MALIQRKELRTMPVEEIKAKLEELKKELMRENAQVATGTIPKSPGKIKQIKKTIAKILTILNEKKVKNSEVKQKKDGNL